MESVHCRLMLIVRKSSSMSRVWVWWRRVTVSPWTGSVRVVFRMWSRTVVFPGFSGQQTLAKIL